MTDREHRQLRVGLVGAGVMGAHYTAVLHEYPRSEIVAVCDLVTERAASLARPAGAPAFSTVESMLATADPDAVVVATPDFAHRDPVLAAIAAGKAVLCEKPLATTREDCAAMTTAAAGRGAPFMVNLGNRHRPAALRLRQAMRDEGVGAVQYVHARLNERRDKTATLSWRGRTSPVWFLLSHCVDLVRWATGEEFVRVHAHGRPGSPDVVAVLAELGNGAAAVLESAWHLPVGFAPQIDFRVEVIGEQGVLQADLFPHDLQLFTTEARALDHTFGVRDVAGRLVGWWQDSVRYFVDCVLDGRQPSPGPREAWQVTEVLLAIDASLQSGQPQAVATVAGEAPA